MMKKNKLEIQIGDWVRGKLKDGELFHGYIEDIYPLQGTVKVYVVACDNEKAIGRNVETLINRVVQLPITMSVSEEQIINLVDLALETNDEQWFMELSTKLQSIRQNETENSRSNNANSTSKNKMTNRV